MHDVYCVSLYVAEDTLAPPTPVTNCRLNGGPPLLFQPVSLSYKAKQIYFTLEVWCRLHPLNFLTELKMWLKFSLNSEALINFNLPGFK